MFGTKILNDFENESFSNLNFLLRSTENLVKKGVYAIPLVLNRWSADWYRSTTIHADQHRSATIYYNFIL